MTKYKKEKKEIKEIPGVIFVPISDKPIIDELKKLVIIKKNKKDERTGS